MLTLFYKIPIDDISPVLLMINIIIVAGASGVINDDDHDELKCIRFLKAIISVEA